MVYWNSDLFQLTGRHKHEDILAGKCSIDGFELIRAEIL